MKYQTSIQGPRSALVVLGLSAGIGQALLLREAMAATGGSEVAWGTVMALWLLGMAGGSRLGVRAGCGATSHALPFITIGLVGVGVLVFRAAPSLLAAAPGETITTWRAGWLWAVAVIPPAFSGGWAFPIFADRLSSGGAGRAYALEAFGALAGGFALSLVLAPMGTAVALCLTAAVTVPWALGPGHRVVAAAGALALVVAALFAGDALAQATWRWSGHPGELSRWLETRQQRLELTAGPPYALYADGRLTASFPDPYTTVPAAHLVMLLHPEPGRVFTVGCLADGAITTMVRHPSRHFLVVEDDPRLAKTLPRWYGPDLEKVLENPRVEIRTTDPIRALRATGPWDLIVLRDSNPITIRHNRTRTVEFFKLCRQRLADDGVLVVRLGLSDTYLGGSAGRLFDLMVSTLREVFPKVVALPGEQVLLVAGDAAADIRTEPATLEDRWRERNLVDPAFAPEMIEVLVDPARARDLNDAAAAVDAPINTRQHPRAVLVAAGLAEARARPFLSRLSKTLEGRSPRPLAAVVVVVSGLLLVTTLRRRPPAAQTAMVVGACSMGWWLLLLAAWQSTVGSVYAEVGALTATFMGGLAIGSLSGSKSRRPDLHVPPLLLAGAVVSLVLASPTVFTLPVVVVPALLAIGGLLTGAAFPGLAHMAGGTATRRGAGIAFAADEAGAAAAAILIGVLALPWAGLTATAIGLAVVELSAIPAVVRSLRRSSRHQ